MNTWNHTKRIQGEREHGSGTLPLSGLRVGCLGCHGSLFINENKTQEEKLKYGREKQDHSGGQFMEVIQDFLKAEFMGGVAQIFIQMCS